MEPVRRGYHQFYSRCGMQARFRSTTVHLHRDTTISLRPQLSGDRPNVSFGSDLRHERESRGISLAEVADRTKVSVRFLSALECDIYADLPGGVFTRGMIRNYCIHLNLDPLPWLQQFAAQHAAEPAERDWVEFAQNVQRTRVATGAPRSRWWGIALLLLAFVALTWLCWHLVLRHHKQPPAPQTRSQAL